MHNEQVAADLLGVGWTSGHAVAAGDAKFWHHCGPAVFDLDGLDRTLAQTATTILAFGLDGVNGVLADHATFLGYCGGRAGVNCRFHIIQIEKELYSSRDTRGAKRGFGATIRRLRAVVHRGQGRSFRKMETQEFQDPLDGDLTVKLTIDANVGSSAALVFAAAAREDDCVGQAVFGQELLDQEQMLLVTSGETRTAQADDDFMLHTESTRETENIVRKICRARIFIPSSERDGWQYAKLYPVSSVMNYFLRVRQCVILVNSNFDKYYTALCKRVKPESRQKEDAHFI
jgi:hypothetical protein